MRKRMLSLAAMLCAAVLLCGSWSAQALPPAAITHGGNAPAGTVARQSPFSPQAVVVTAAQLLAQGAAKADADLYGEGVLVQEDEEIRFEVDIPEAGSYRIGLEYQAVAGRSNPVELVVLADGTDIVDAAGMIELPRLWANEVPGIQRDANDNDIRPVQMEHSAWQSRYLCSPDDRAVPVSVTLSKGKHSFQLASRREGLVIRQVVVEREQPLPTYREYALQTADWPAAQQSIHVQGEENAWRSDTVLMPLEDRGSAITEFSSGSRVRLNTVGGYAWKTSGQAITWVIDVPEDGLYKLQLRARQNYSKGLYSARRLEIDGQVPFAEAAELAFTYESDWQIFVPRSAEGEECLFALSAGQHEITLTSTLGRMAEVINPVRDSLAALNNIYTQIMMITGATPDTLRDYSFQTQIPQVIEEMQVQSDLLYQTADAAKALAGLSGGDLAPLETMARQLAEFHQKPYQISQRFESFKNNLSSLEYWFETASERPLDIDYLDFSPPDAELLRARAGFWEQLGHDADLFFGSFTNDYESFAATGEGKALKVWVTTGRDQAQAINELIRTSFTPQTGIPVEIQLITRESVLPAIAAGSGADVWMQARMVDVVDYASRGAVLDLRAFEGVDEVLGRFSRESYRPFEYLDGVYALPETQTFPLMFIRNDLFTQLGLEPPETWDELIDCIPVLSANNMYFLIDGRDFSPDNQYGSVIPTSMTTLAMMLYQSGGEFYNGDGISSALDSETAIQAFTGLTRFCTNYGMPVTFNSFNYFKRGEAPLVVADLSLYNQLMSSAPELKGLWSMYRVPGTPQADGSVDHTVRSSSNGCMVMSNTENPQGAWQLLQWWTSTETQVAYARSVEALMGSAARYASANLQAFESLPWSRAELAVIEQQRAWARGVPEVPGGYYTLRDIENAYLAVVVEGEDPRETLLDHVRRIDTELYLKRLEFGLPAEKPG